MKQLIYKTLKYFKQKIDYIFSPSTKVLIPETEQSLLQTIPSIMSKNHNCALIALHRVLPQIPEEKILNAFSRRCKKWPEAGVLHNEFGMVLRDLKIRDKFKYHSERSPILNFEKNENFVILLIHKHFTVIYKRRIHDIFYRRLPSSTLVYCAWELLI